MTDDEIDYTRYALPVTFPRRQQDLLSTTQCPACFAVLTSTVCKACGLDVAHPDAVKLHDASLAAAAQLDERVRTIGRIRYDTEQARTRAAASEVATAGSLASTGTASPVVHAPTDPTAPAAPAAAAPSPAAPPPAAPSPAMDTDAATPPAQPWPLATAGDQPRRRSSVQVTLLIVGVSLLSIAAIFFLVYAFINFGIIWRSVIIAAITVAALVGASLLRRRSLTATAEGIAVFGVVLIYLDAYAIRANNFFDTARTDGQVYWGVVFIVAALGFIGWHLASKLRIPSIVGFASFPLGVGILVGGITRDLPMGTSVFLSFLAMAVAGLIHPLATRAEQPAFLERTIVLSVSFVAIIISFGACLTAYAEVDLAPTCTALVVAGVAALHVWALWAHRQQSEFNRTFALLFSAIVGISAAAAVGLSATRIDDSHFQILAPSIAAAAVALAFSVVAGRLAGRTLKAVAVVAGWSSAAVLALALLWPAAVVGMSVATAVLGVPPWSIQPTELVTLWAEDSEWAVFALAIITILAAAVWAATGRLRTSAGSTTVLSAALVTIVVAVPELRIQWQVMSGWLALAIACFAVLLFTRARTAARKSHRGVFVIAMIVAGVLGYLVGLATTSTWWIGTLVVIGLMIASRSLVQQASSKAALLGIGIGFALLSVGSVADQLTHGVGIGFDTSLANHLLITAIASAVVLLGAAIPDGATSALDRRVEFWIAATAAVVSVPATMVALSRLSPSTSANLLFPEHWAVLTMALLLLLALGLWLGLRRNQPLRAERAMASVAVAPALYLLVSSFANLLQLPEFVTTVVPITAAVLAAAGSLAVTTLRPTSTPRWTRELGVALVSVPAVFAAVRADDGLTWLVLLLAAVVALLLAIDRDGLFSSRSVRHHIGWLALILATAGLWWRLNGDRVTDLEFYLVPVTLALLIIAALIALTARRENPPRDAAAAPALVLGGLLVSILPLGVNAATGSMAHAIWLGAVSAALLLVGSAIHSAVRGGMLLRWFADACALAGAIGVLVVTTGRALFLAVTEPERDVWLAAGFLVLVVAAFLQVGIRDARSERLRVLAGQVLGLLALTMVLLLELPAVRDITAGDIRALTLVLLFSAVHVIAFLVARPPLTRLVSFVSIAYAAVIGIAGVSFGSLDPVEVASIPIALALLATGTVQLAASPSSRSWPWLGPGTAILLVTSLLATLDERPLWRLVGLGVVAVATIVIAVVSRLQAPFVIAVVVVLIHGVATFLPQLRAAYEFLPWWLWLGAGGVLLIVLAARYEQRIRDLRTIALKFAALR
jgi:hypothetical protein